MELATLSEEGKRKKQIDLYVKSIGAEDKQLNLMDMKAVNMAVRLLYTGGGTLKSASAAVEADEAGSSGGGAAAGAKEESDDELYD